jgi:hypothetical protein
MGCGCGRKRASNPVSSPSLRQMRNSTVTYILVSSSGAEVSSFDNLETARREWTKYRKETDGAARLLQRTVSSG